MQLTTSLLALFSSTALAATLSTFASTEWTLQSLTRVCDATDSSCTWKFGINTNEAGVAVTPCTYVVNSTAAATASQSNGGPISCGVFNITSGWSGQFGPGQGFTVISVVDYAKKLIVYAGYTDAMVGNGTVVNPDLSFPVQTLQ
ncbi:surface protein 1 [Xylariaceae sp. FL1651]|nr:surface protein 1 [Xylariaceae sp. FL1651]